MDTIFVSGTPVRLGTRIGKGGEGEVFALADRPSEAVKIYLNGQAASRQAKIRAMVDAGLANATKLVAYPVECVADAKGRFLGFTMAKVSEHKPLHELYAPGARKAEFPQAGYQFLVRTAANMARAVAAVHRSGCVIGDLNHSGVLVSDKATVALIDADSFQLVLGPARYLCKVGVPEYTPPELQGRPLDSVVRTPDHDAFGLAIAVFQLLWMGRHPYSGRYSAGDMPLERAIAENRFVYSRLRKSGMTPPPAAAQLADFPPEVSGAFERAFGGPGARPSAEEWAGILERLEKGLRSCAASTLHHYPQAASQCPWCRMENALGAQLFVPRLSSAPYTAAGDLDLDSLWRTIEAVRPPPPAQLPAFKQVNAKPTQAAIAARNAERTRKLSGVVIGLASIGGLVGLQSLALLWIGGFIWAGALLLTTDKRRAAAITAARTKALPFDAELADWFSKCGNEKFDAARAELGLAKVRLVRMADEEKRLVDAYGQNRKTEQRKAYLERFQIRRDKITGIGPSKLATLMSYGIEDASDVTYQSVSQVPGFGPVTTSALLTWRAAIEGRFVYDPRPNQFDRSKLAAIKGEVARKSSELQQALRRGPAYLAHVGSEISKARSRPHAHLQIKYEERCGAEADLRLFGQTLGPIKMPAIAAAAPSPIVGRRTRPATQTAPAPAATTAGVTCPHCNGRMVLRTARRGSRRGRQFWGCVRYPTCTGTRPF